MDIIAIVLIDLIYYEMMEAINTQELMQTPP